MGFKKPNKIQAITLPMILSPPYKDLIAQAHNGMGKTTCFGLGKGRVGAEERGRKGLGSWAKLNLMVVNIRPNQIIGVVTILNRYASTSG
ncbi:DEAD-box ATP-dependent RNA helicase 38 [Pyrus ussuriensis x Pyrus communis]|uniref:DEAD-box ATP-dependent RNA helicase 38 n=1 Tax=Pyrus ussuriensis x Pyrus communis TaxID=2448454 RepID=A0A5N5GH69_9ROSA|nr:DEAD-box ATP-dependent RNA helicase 38 [Pyrus ussuriensis x Pyrus communis]